MSAGEEDLFAGPKLRVAITGASGLIGTALAERLERAEHAVVRLVRRDPRGPREVRWDPSAGTIDAAALEGVDAIVHLAGENVGDGRWTAERKARIRESRVSGTRTVVEAIRRLEKKPILISASAIGIYGDRGDELLEEGAPLGTGFLADVVRAWEGEAEKAASLTRVALPRVGVVLTAKGGALAKMKTPFSLGVGGPIGSGRQWMSWIALDDVLRGVAFAIRGTIEGPFHLVAPGAVTNAEFSRTLARVLHRPAIARVPAIAIRAAFGEMGSVILEGQHVVPRRLRELGFAWRWPALEPLLRAELG